VEIDPRARRIRLHDPPSWHPPPGSASVPLTFRHGHAFIPVRLTLASGEEIERELQFDIGSNSAVSLVAGSHVSLPMPEGEAKYGCLVSGKQEHRVGAPLRLTYVDAEFLPQAANAMIRSALMQAIKGSSEH